MSKLEKQMKIKDETYLNRLNFLIITGLVSFILLVAPQLQPANGWPAGTTEAQKEKIMTVTSDDELTVEESGIADDRVYEIFDAFSSDTQEYKDLIECGFVDKYAFEVLQCWENKGHSVR